jgi:hypothetical protein
MDFFDWSPFEIFIIGQMCLGLVLLLAFSFLKAAPADQLSVALHEAELQLQKLRALTKDSTEGAIAADQAAA